MKRIINCTLVLLMILGMAFFAVSCDNKNGIDIPGVKITGSEGEIFSNLEGRIEISEASVGGTLNIESTSETKTELTIVYKSEDEIKEAKISLEPMGKGELTVSQGSLYSVMIAYMDADTGAELKTEYPAGMDAFAESLKSGKSTHTVLAFDLEADLIEITRPVSLVLEGDLKAKRVYCHGDFEGKIVIDEEDGELKSDEFFADGLGIILEMPKLKSVEENPTYFLRVKRYNSREFENDTITVKNAEQWSALYSENALPVLYSGVNIVFSGEFELPVGIVINKPVGIRFEKGVKLLGAVKIVTDENCTLSFSASGATLPDYPIDLEAPNAQVEWDVPRNSGITMYDIAVHLGVTKVNGKAPESYALGGDGNSRLTMITLHKTENKNITKSIIWKADGYVLTAVVDCVVDPGTLKNAKLSLTLTNGGSAEFDESVVGKDGGINLLASTGCYVTVTDKNGKSARYLVETEYVPSPLPVVVIDVEDGKAVESNEEYQNATIYMTTDGCEYSPLDMSNIQIRGRGHSTWKWEKKPYKIKFDSKTSLFGLEANKDWTLLANYTDKSLIRNYVAMEGAKLLSFAYTPSQFPVDVFLNGEYVGIYTMGEQLEVKNGRIELQDKGSEKDTGFLLEIGGTSSEDVWNETCFYTTLCKYVKVKAPDSETLTKEQVAFIRDYVKKADEAVMNGVGYEEYIDLDALIDWVIVHELYYNIDCAFRRSCYFTKDVGGKLTMGPIWDFDNAFGNFWKDDKTYSTWATADSTTGYIWDNWMSYLITYPEFREKYRARWDEVKYDLLNKLLESVDKGSYLCQRSAGYNFEVWDILDRRVGCQDSSIKKYNTYEKQISYLRDFINTRWKWMDENI